jgi:non-ribosomal peptide synthetase component E (peptide arylation enzyme)
VSGYGGISAAYSPILNQSGLILGIEGAAILNRRFAIGLAGQALSNSEVGVELDDVERRLEVAFAGVVTRYSFLFNSPVYLTVGAISGAGTVIASPRLREWRDADEDDGLVEREHVDVIAVFQPEATLHVNLTHWMRLALSSGYRVVLGVEKFGAKNNDVAGFVATGGLQFGGF